MQPMGTCKWYPYPWARVRVYAGMGLGGPKNTHGLPVTNPNCLTVLMGCRASHLSCFPCLSEPSAYSHGLPHHPSLPLSHLAQGCHASHLMCDQTSCSYDRLPGSPCLLTHLSTMSSSSPICLWTSTDTTLRSHTLVVSKYILPSGIRLPWAAWQPEPAVSVGRINLILRMDSEE